MPALSRYQCYEVLRIAPKSSPAEIRRAYLNRIREVHPDRFAGSEEAWKVANETAALVNTAYSILRKPAASAEAAPAKGGVAVVHPTYDYISARQQIVEDYRSYFFLFAGGAFLAFLILLGAVQVLWPRPSNLSPVTVWAVWLAVPFVVAAIGDLQCRCSMQNLVDYRPAAFLLPSLGLHLAGVPVWLAAVLSGVLFLSGLISSLLMFGAVLVAFLGLGAWFFALDK